MLGGCGCRVQASSAVGAGAASAAQEPRIWPLLTRYASPISGNKGSTASALADKCDTRFYVPVTYSQCVEAASNSDYTIHSITTTARLPAQTPATFSPITAYTTTKIRTDTLLSSIITIGPPHVVVLLDPTAAGPVDFALASSARQPGTALRQQPLRLSTIARPAQRGPVHRIQ
jgi:hypothetical protein